MLPGFRFLFTAIVLSMSILVFGLGAAALLRAAHETFASTPSLHAQPETNFAQQGEASRPVLSMLRVDAAVTEKAPDNAPAAEAAPAITVPAEPVATGSTPPEPPATAPMPAEPDRIAALQPADSPAPATAKPDTQVAENPPQDQAAPAQDATAAPQAAAPAAADETRVAATTAATEQAPPPVSEAAPAAETAATAEAAPAAPEPASAPSAADPVTFSTTIATLGGPAVAIGPAAKAADPKPDNNAIKKRDQAKRAHRRRRIALRAQLAAQTPQPGDPFAQPVAAPSRLRKPR
jgi:hypothetical protein